MARILQIMMVIISIVPKRDSVLATVMVRNDIILFRYYWMKQYSCYVCFFSANFSMGYSNKACVKYGLDTEESGVERRNGGVPWFSQ